MAFFRALFLLSNCVALYKAASVGDCPGYSASNVATTDGGLTADLKLAGTACNVYGYDVSSLTLEVQYQTDTRLHVRIYDSAQQAYEVPEQVLSRPSQTGSSKDASDLQFTYNTDPFTFAVTRKSSQETIFNTSFANLIFESQYLRLQTALPDSPHLYGLGEHTDSFELPTEAYTRTLWSRDAYEIPPGTNLYGNHPIYFENRGGQTHGVFLLNSNGMDIKIDRGENGQYLEYNTIGGIIDLYFLAGPGPVDVAQQYSQVVGTPAMMPYWGLGFHQCRYGYRDVYEVAGVVANYSAANIPLETMWTDIDYMDARKIFTLDPDRYPLEKVRELVSYLHDHDQHYIVMVDPAVAYQNYSAFQNGVDQGIFMKNADGSVYQGVVWPGVTAFPDWFNPDTQAYWNGEFDSFFSADSGVDIDALWIDMNEASNFCSYPCDDPEGYAAANGFPPAPPPVRPDSPIPLPGFPSDFQPSKRAPVTPIGLPNRDLLNPSYQIANAAGSLSNKTINTDLIHAGSSPYAEYDTHNLYGTMMSSASRAAMLSRRPSLRPMIITRSTFAGAGHDVGHWLGDNAATWDDYRISIAEQIAFAGIYQISMVGSDVCGYAMDTTENLCSRWAMLGAFSTFYRNHAEAGKDPQEFYNWPDSVAVAARTAIDIRYRMLDYIYTAMHAQSVDGTPTLNPLWFLYPSDAGTYGVDTQFFFGDAVLVSPVTDEDATSVSIYLPDDVFYDWYTQAPVQGSGATIDLTSIGFTTIPLHIRGGTIVPLRSQSANTTTAVRENGFTVLVAPGRDGNAAGSLYLDDGVSLQQGATSDITFSYTNGKFSMSGDFGYDMGDVGIDSVVVLGQTQEVSSANVQGKSVSGGDVKYNSTSGAVTVKVAQGLAAGFEMSIGG